MTRAKTTLEVADYRVRRLGLSAKRLAGWWLAPGRWPRPERHVGSRDGDLAHLVGEVRAPLARRDAHADPALEAGKRTNLGIAAPHFDGLFLTPARPLSFWRTLGRANEARGFTWGMELRGGCVVPSIAGGLCLLTNALFELAVRAGWRIVERSGHTLEAIEAEPGAVTLDATVAWPDVDLVIAPTVPVRLVVRIEGDDLVVAAFAATPNVVRVELSKEETIEARSSERWRAQKISRRRFDADGALIGSETVAVNARRILDANELGRTCITCGEEACRDRPAEPVLVSLRRAGR